MAVGARGVITQHPFMQTLRSAGESFRDMGKLFMEMRQARAYEQSVMNQRWLNLANATMESYDRLAAATDEGVAYNAMAPTLKGLLVEGGMDPAVAGGMLRRVTDENVNARIALGRIFREAFQDDTGLNQEKAVTIVEDLIGRKREDQAIEDMSTPEETPSPRPEMPGFTSPQGPGGVTPMEPPAPTQPAPLWGQSPTGPSTPPQPLRGEAPTGPPTQPRPTMDVQPGEGPSTPEPTRGSFIERTRPATAPEGQPQPFLGAEEYQAASEGQVLPGPEQFQESFGLSMTKLNIGNIRRMVQEGQLDPRKLYPQLEQAWTPRLEAATKSMLDSLENGNLNQAMKALDIWSKAMYEEAK